MSLRQLSKKKQCLFGLAIPLLLLSLAILAMFLANKSFKTDLLSLPLAILWVKSLFFLLAITFPLSFLIDEDEWQQDLCALGIDPLAAFITAGESGQLDLQLLPHFYPHGILIFDGEGVVLPWTTPATIKLLEGDPCGQQVNSLLGLQGAGALAYHYWREQIFQGPLSPESFILLLNGAPKSFMGAKGSHLRLEYLPFFAGQKFGRQLREKSAPLRYVVCLLIDDGKKSVSKLQQQQLQSQLQEKERLLFTTRILQDLPAFQDATAVMQNHLLQLQQWAQDGVMAGLSQTGQPFPSHSQQDQLDQQTQYREDLPRLCGQIYHFFHYYGSISGASLSFQLSNYVTNALSEQKALTSAFWQNLYKRLLPVQEEQTKFIDLHKDILFAAQKNQMQKKREFKREMIEETLNYFTRQYGSQSLLAGKFLQEFVLEDFALSLDKYRRVVDFITLKQNKEADLIIESPQGPILVCLSPYQALLSSFVHIIRNAVDHGLESPLERVRSGKKPSGKITINLHKMPQNNHGPRMRFIFADDGRGVDVAVVSAKALEKKLIDPGELAQMNQHGILQLLFKNGLSTRNTSSEFSGRGVGLDAVKYEAWRLGGTAWLETELGKGSKIFVEVPIFESPVEARGIIKAA